MAIVGPRRLLPITVGVIGHRDLDPEQVPAITRSACAVLEDLRRRAPDSPLLILSSLAEGADRLIVQVATGRFGADYAAVLPRPVEDYRRDFPSPDSAAEFDRMVAGARFVLVQGSSTPIDPTNASAANDAYLAAGAWISLHSHLVIALWDGQPSRGRGGTADVVELRRRGRYPGLNDADPLNYAESGTTAQLVVRRVDGPSVGEDCAIAWHYSDVETRYAESPSAHFHRSLADIDCLNRLARTCSAGDTEHASTSSWLGQVSDELAGRFQRRVKSTAFLLVVATLAAVTAAAPGDWLPPVLAAALRYGSLSIGAVAGLWSRFARWPGHYADFRAVAEAMRIQVAWRAAGLPDAVADAYHPVQAMEVGWIRRVVRTAGCLDLLASAQRSGATAPRHSDPAAARAWLDGQFAYFLGRKGVLARYRRQRRLLSMMWLACICAVFVILGYGKVLDLGMDLWGSKGWEAVKENLAVLLSVASSALAAGAALATYQSIVAIRELENAYATTAHLYTVARDSLQEIVGSGDGRRQEGLLRAIGKAALVENTWWLLLRRQRQPKSPG